MPDIATRPAPETAASAAASKPRRGHHWAVVLSLQVGFFVFVVALWQILVDTGTLDAFFFSRPSDIARRLADWLTRASIYHHLAITLAEALMAFVIGAISGVFAGFALARVDLLAAVFDPYIRILNALPRVILAPIFILWFGLGMASKVALGVTLVFFIVFFNTFQGVREVDPVILKNARMLRATESHLLRHVYIPSALSWIFSSLHTSIGFALVGAVVGEYIGSSQGIGYLVAQAQGTFDTTGVFAGLLLTSIVVLLIDLGINRIEGYLLRWKPQKESH